MVWARSSAEGSSSERNREAGPSWEQLGLGMIDDGVNEGGGGVQMAARLLVEASGQLLMHFSEMGDTG